MPAHELLVDGARDGSEVARAALLEEQREEERLKEEIAELVDELVVVGSQHRVGDFVGLLDGVRDDRLRGLRPVPRTVPPEAFRQLLEVDESAGELVPVRHASRRWSFRRWCRSGSRGHSPERR